MKQPLGADLIIPALALGFAAYFFVSIADLAWEAKANGVVIGSVLVVLVLIQLARIGVRILRGRANLSLAPVLEPRDALPKRLGLIAVTVAFIATLYGVLSANVIWLPLGERLKQRNKEEVGRRQLAVEGVLAVQAGDNPRVVREKLEAFLPLSLRGADEPQTAAKAAGETKAAAA